MQKSGVFIAILLVIPFVAAQYMYNPNIGQAQVCYEGDTRCDGNTFLVCSNGDWQSQQCEYDCDSQQGCVQPTYTYQVTPEQPPQARAVCVMGDKRCDGNDFQKCVNNVWQTQQTCSKYQDCTSKGCVSRPVAVVQPPPVSVKKCLDCPSVPKKEFIFPPAPYDEEIGDCALLGKSDEIAAYVKALEGIAASCKSQIAIASGNMLSVKLNIDGQIDKLPVGTEKAPDYSCFKGSPPVIELLCPIYGSAEPLESPEGIEPEGFHYTIWLKHLMEDTNKYCNMVADLPKPVLDGCAEIKFYMETCKGTRSGTIPEYHKLMDTKFNVATDKLDYLDFFYTKTLHEYGFDSFKKYYKESSINCPGLTKVAPKIPEVKPEIEMIPMAKEEKPKSLMSGIVSFFKKLFSFGKKLTCPEECEKSYDDCVKEANKWFSITDRMKAKLFCNEAHSACLDSCEEKELESGRLKEPPISTPEKVEETIGMPEGEKSKGELPSGVSKPIIVPPSGDESMLELTCRGFCARSYDACVKEANKWFSISDRMKAKYWCTEANTACLAACEKEEEEKPSIKVPGAGEEPVIVSSSDKSSGVTEPVSVPKTPEPVVPPSGDESMPELTCRGFCARSYDACVKEANKWFSISDRTKAKYWCNEANNACLAVCKKEETKLPPEVMTS